jgi:capsular polysaccharide biosynthesis protein
MTSQAILNTMIRKWRDIAVAFVLCGALAFFFAVATIKRYSVQTDYLIVQNGINYRDLYSLSKSAEYAGNVLSDAIFSQLFIDEAGQTGRFDVRTLPEDPKARLAAWGRMVSVQKNFQSNILTVTVRDDKSENALALANAVSQVLTERNAIFRTGTPDSITIKVISGPITEKNPSAQLLTLVTALGALIGAGFVIGLSIISEPRIRNEGIMVPSPSGSY